MSNSTLFRVAGVAGILSAILMMLSAVAGNTAGAMSPLIALPSAVCGILLAAGLYVLYRSEASLLSLVAVGASIVGYLLFAAGSLLALVFPHPVLEAADILIFIVGLGLFSWLAFRLHKLPRLLAIVGFMAALVGASTYVVTWATGASFESAPPMLMALYFLYLIGVVVWLAWTGIALLRLKPATVTVQTPASVAG